MAIQDAIDDLKKDLPGYHFEIIIYPAGGILDAVACEECGTEGDRSASWGINRRNKTIDDAVSHIKKQVSEKKNAD